MSHSTIPCHILRLQPKDPSDSGRRPRLKAWKYDDDDDDDDDDVPKPSSCSWFYFSD